MNPASELAKKRWAKKSDDERKAILAGVRSKRKRKSKARRIEIARAAALARWAKYRADKDLRGKKKRA